MLRAQASTSWRSSKRAEELAQLRGERMENTFGSQIRNYVLYPYQLVKDVRSGIETGNVDAVLDGELEEFVIGYHQWMATTVASRRRISPVGTRRLRTSAHHRGR